jgi:hypothetical protein
MTLPDGNSAQETSLQEVRQYAYKTEPVVSRKYQVTFPIWVILMTSAAYLLGLAITFDITGDYVSWLTTSAILILCLANFLQLLILSKASEQLIQAAQAKYSDKVSRKALMAYNKVVLYLGPVGLALGAVTVLIF